jgi:hypothetical protein
MLRPSAVLMLTALALSPLPSAAIQGTPAPAYPTDACVAEKLRAAAQYCMMSILEEDPTTKPNPRRLEQAREKLTKAFTAAERTSADAGVACADTTVNASEMIGALDAGAAALSEAIATSTADDPKAENRCEAGRHQAAAIACFMLLKEQGHHLLTRAWDRERTQLERRETLLTSQLEHAWTNGQANACTGGPSAEEGVALVEDAVDDALELALVSPRVSSEWTMVTPDAEVPYLGRTLEPICSYGTPWVFFVKRGTVNKTVMYYQGGGACWDYTTCSLPTHKTATGPNDNPANFQSGFANFNNPDNPFKDWNAVFVPYCTGDIHWGDAVVDHARGNRSIRVYHRGFQNAQVAEKWAREHFVNPDQVFVTGSSAGSYGAIVNSLPLQEYVWPSSDFAVVGDAGNGVITQDFLENEISKWNVEANLPSWIPEFNVPIEELDASRLLSISANAYPQNRFANYTTAYDGGQGGQVGFYNIMLNPGNPIVWLNWWVPTCEWNEIMRSYVQASYEDSPGNYRYYVGSGSRHTMWGNNKVYTDTTGNVPTIKSWLEAMLADTPDWVNVDSDDPGLLLSGDPRPDPPLPPYTEDGRIDCESPPADE